MPDRRLKVYMIGDHASEYEADARRELESVGAETHFLPFLTDEEQIVAHTCDADGLIVVSAPITRGVLSSLTRCRVVVRTGVGVDSVDVPAATELGVAVVNVPDLWPREVANHAMMLMLACNRRLRHLDQQVRAGRWDSRIPQPVGALHDEIMGIVGLGQIGVYFARRAAAFEMELIAADPYAPASIFEELGAEQVTLNELLRRSDYVSVHTPTPRTPTPPTPPPPPPRTPTPRTPTPTPTTPTPRTPPRIRQQRTPTPTPMTPPRIRQQRTPTPTPMTPPRPPRQQLGDRLHPRIVEWSHGWARHKVDLLTGRHEILRAPVSGTRVTEFSRRIAPPRRIKLGLVDTVISPDGPRRFLAAGAEVLPTGEIVRQTDRRRPRQRRGVL